MAKSELRVGMISWAHVHAEFRAKALGEIPGARVVAISDDNAERGQSAAKRFGVQKFHKRWQDLIADQDVDVVMVHSENSRHADQVVAAAEAGKHVFCEKPVATKVADAVRMVAAVEKAGVQGTAAFVSRFSKEASRTKALVDSGILGDIINLRALIGLAGIPEIGCPPDMTAWMENAELNGGGAWIDEGSHAIDLMRWVAGDITRVAAFSANRAKPRFKIEDIAVAILRFQSGALGEAGTAWSMALDIGMRNHLEIYGTKGALIMRATDPFPRVEVYDASGAPLTRGWNTPHIEPDAKEPHDYGSWPPHLHHYKREVASYVSRYLADQKPFGPTLRDGLACLAVIEAGYVSTHDGGNAVAVPSVDALLKGKV
ncbi:MAG TPA: Gfo/Idh/MocA family oxidoreductase [Bauldia sp.]|nr:Gfo/Idh/MocA family oxidoreductase [Bauldia sp.]